VQRYTLNILLALASLGLVLAAYRGLLDSYVLTVIMFIGINIIFAASLNLVNGYMGEFSCGHGGFMCVGAYVGSVLSVICFSSNKILGPALLSPALAPWIFPLILLASGMAAAFFGLLVALPSFSTRGDYLAIITIAANYMIISLVENIDIIGGPRGLSGMKRTMNAMHNVVNIPWMLIWVIIATIATLALIRRLVSSTYGKGIRAICQNEVSAEIMGVNNDRVKIVAFMVSSGLAGVSGALYAHIFGYVNPQAFNILKSTEAMVMVYLGGMGSLSGSVLAAIIFTLLVEGLRFAIPALNDLLHMINLLPDGYTLSQIWKWVLIPLLLILIMQFRPEGIMGNRELSDVFPRLKRWVTFK
jgi:branched-chain amino acid transport system permease protein